MRRTGVVSDDTALQSARSTWASGARRGLRGPDAQRLECRADGGGSGAEAWRLESEIAVLFFNETGNTASAVLELMPVIHRAFVAKPARRPLG